MPTDAATTLEPKRPENIGHGLRLALTPWIVFCAGMTLGLPLAFVGAVFAVIFSIGLKPVPVSYGLSLLCKSAAIMLAAWWLSATLLPYPVVFLVAVCVAVVAAYSLQLRTNDLLLSVFAVIAALLIPYLTRASSELAGTIAFWLLVNVLVSMVASWAVFLVFPEPKTAAPAAVSTASSTSDYDEERRLLRLAVVAVPFVVVAFVLDVITPFVLVFVAIQSTQIVANTSSHGGVSQNILVANGIGGLVAVLVYESMVMVPFLPFAIAIVFACLVWFSRRFINGDTRIMSAITAFLILVGGTLMPFSDDAQTKMVARLWQLALAFGYLSLAFLVVDKLIPERTGRTD